MRYLKFSAVALLLLLNPTNGFCALSLSDSGMNAESFVDTGAEQSIEITLSGTPGTLTTVTLPDTAKGFKLYPRSNHVRFAVYQSSSARTLAAVATDSDGTVAATDFAIGGIAKADQWETRLLPSKLVPSTTTRILTLRSTTASVVCDLEVF